MCQLLEDLHNSESVFYKWSMPVMLKNHAYVKVQNRVLGSNVTDKW